MYRGIQPALFSASNSVADAIRKLDRAQLAFNRRALDPIRKNDSPTARPLNDAERAIEGDLVSVTNRLGLVNNALAAYFDATRSSRNDFSRVHEHIGVDVKTDEVRQKLARRIT